MKRYLTLAALLLCAFPVGLSVGCSVNPNDYCPGSGNVVSINTPTQIILQPQNGALSLGYGQTRLLSSPKITNCLGSSVAVKNITYGSSAPNLLDISPTGTLCAGTWRKNIGGTTSDYTICDPPVAGAIPSELGLSYSDVTVSAESVTSNVVPVFVHPKATSASLYLAPAPNSDGSYTCTAPTSCGTTTNVLNSCLSQNAQKAYCVQVCAGNEDISPAVGTVTLTTQNSSIATFNSSIFANAGSTGEIFGPPVTLATGGSPGASTLSVNASLTTVDAGVFATCSPKSIVLQQSTTGDTSFALDLNASQSLTATVVDTAGVTMTSTPLTFFTNAPQTYSVTAAGQVSAILGGAGDVYAVCLPPTCNPAPSQSTIGGFNTDVGQPLASNAVRLTTPTTTASYVYAVSYSSPVVGVLNTQLANPAPGSLTLPFTPNSAVLRQDGGLLIFGSTGTPGVNAELMFVSTSSNAVLGFDNNITGKVLALNPAGNILVLSNADTGQTYLYTVPSTIAGNMANPYITIGGVGEKAHFTPDGQTIYIEGYITVNGTQQPEEFVYDAFSGLTEYAVPAPLNDVAVLTPPVGAFYASTADTTALGYCTQTTPTVQPFAPLPGVMAPPDDALYASLDGLHVFGANASVATFNDIAVGLETQNAPNGVIPNGPAIPVPVDCRSETYGVAANDIPYPLPVPAGAAITTVQATPDSTAAVVAYTGGTAGTLPAYVIGTTDTPQTVPLLPGKTAAASPISAVSSQDSSTFFVGTSGDNQIHFISVAALKACAAGATTCAADTGQTSTGIVTNTGATLPADLLLERAIKPLQ